MAQSRRNVSQEPPEFEEQTVQVDRVTRVVKGGKRMRFRALVVIGDRKGRVGAGLGKGSDVSLAVAKATNQAKKNLLTVPLKDSTIPHEVRMRYCGAEVFMKPAHLGTGVIAGGAVRTVLEMAGVRDVLSKSYGSNNKINNVWATLLALSAMKTAPASAAKPAQT